MTSALGLRVSQALEANDAAWSYNPVLTPEEGKEYLTQHPRMSVLVDAFVKVSAIAVFRQWYPTNMLLTSN